MNILQNIFRHTIPPLIIILMGLFFIVGSGGSGSSSSSDTTAGSTTTTVAQKRLEISYFGEGRIRVVGDDNALQCEAARLCVGDFAEGSTITLVAEEDPNWTFDNWQYCDSVEQGQCTITMNSEKLLNATFKSIEDLATYDNVVLLSEDQIRAISDFSHESGVLVLQANTPIDDFNVGTIIISKGIYLGENDANNVEIYFSRRIKKVVALTGSPIIIDTSEASMADFIREGNINYQTDIEQSKLPAQLPKGMTLRPISAKQRAEKIIPLELDLVIYDADGDESTTVDQIKAKGTLDFSLRPDFDFHFSITRGLTEFRALLESSSQSDLQFSIGAEVTLVEKKLSISPRIRLAPVSIGPVVFIPEINLTFVYEVGVEGAIEPRLEISSKTVGGVHYLKNNGWRNIATHDLDAKPTFAAEVKAKAYVQAGPMLSLSVLVYGVAGPEIGIQAFAGLETFAVIPPKENCLWDYAAFVGAKGVFSGVIRLLSKELSYEATLFEVKNTLDDFTKGCSIDATEAPSAPSDLSISDLTKDSLKLNWSPATDTIGIKEYQVYRNDTLVSGNTVDIFYLDTRLTPATEYCYYLIAVDTSGNTSAASETVCATTASVDITLPSTPENLQATPQSTTAIALTWDAAFDDVGVNAYLVLDSTNDDANIPDFIVQRTQDPHTVVTGLTPDTEYCYKVSAVDATGNVSSPSIEACATTLKIEQSKWTIKMACQNRNYLLEQQLDLDEDVLSSVSVTGEGQDYDGSNLAYALSGAYNAETTTLEAEIIWAFEGRSERRRDVFTADLSQDDTGNITMNQVEVTGCAAMIRFIKNTGEATADQATKIEESLIDTEQRFFME